MLYPFFSSRRASTLYGKELKVYRQRSKANRKKLKIARRRSKDDLKRKRRAFALKARLVRNR